MLMKAMLFRARNKLDEIHSKECQLMQNSDLLTSFCKKPM